MVFCKECIYYIGGKYLNCEHPENITTKHDWERRWEEHIYRPSKINKNNNCKRFKQR